MSPKVRVGGRVLDAAAVVPSAVIDARASILAGLPPELRAAIAPILERAPILGLTIRDVADPSTWIVTFDATTTREQRADAEAQFLALDLAQATTGAGDVAGLPTVTPLEQDVADIKLRLFTIESQLAALLKAAGVS